LGSIVGIFAQLGDLLESVFKRDVGVKDSGRILPGHGGFLDRFDAFFVVSPVYYIFVKILILVG
ncbi:MAG TPA: phosphatidate cytidylyltransferase, partial [Candidatus Marinimicrobia bacterium]|nr:phosphatidate cytidylyltransferase [Candidatus Neomarinimicrobiota bacterium]